MLPCFGWKGRVELQLQMLQLPGPALIPSRVQTDVWHQFAFPPSWWHKVGGGCIRTSHIYKNPDSLAWQKRSEDLFPACVLDSFGPKWGFTGDDSRYTSGLSTAPFIWEHLLRPKEAPSVLAGEGTPGMSGQVIRDSTQFQQHLFKNQSKAIHHSSLLSWVESVCSNHMAINYIIFYKSINNLSTIHQYILSIVSKHDY